MRIVASACLVLVVLFMVGCGASAEDKAAIKANTDAIAQMKAQADAMKPAADAMNAKLMAIETFLKDPKAKFGMYGMPPDTTKKPEPTKPMGKPAAPKGTGAPAKKAAPTPGPGTGK